MKVRLCTRVFPGFLVVRIGSGRPSLVNDDLMTACCSHVVRREPLIQALPAATAPSKNVISARARHRRLLLAPQRWPMTRRVMVWMHRNRHNRWITV